MNTDLFFEIPAGAPGGKTLLAILFNEKFHDLLDPETMYQDLAEGKLPDNVILEFLRAIFSELRKGNPNPVLFLKSGQIPLKRSLNVFLDTETTGFGDFNRVIQLSYKVKYGPDEVAFFDDYLRVAKKMSKEATNINGITDEFLQKNGRNPADVYFFLRHVLSVSDNAIAYNAAFDKKMLLVSATDEITTKEIRDIPWICCYKYATYKGHKGKLVNIYEKLTGNKKDGAHNSRVDVEMMEEVFEILRKL